jgi:hypothetical protein
MKQGLTGEVEGKRLGPIPRLVYLALLTRSRLKRKEATSQDLADFLGFDRRTVEKALLELWELGLVERGAVGWWAPLDPVRPPLHAVQPSVHGVQGEGQENAVLDGSASALELIGKQQQEKTPLLHSTSHPPTPPSAEEAEEVLEEDPLEELLGENLDRGTPQPPSLEPRPEPGRTRDVAEPSKPSPALVKPGTKPLRRVLEGAGLWREFWRVFRPGFANGALFGAYLHRLEREALPLGDAFLEALSRTLEGAKRGVVRYPAAYLEQLLQERALEGGQVPSLASSPEPPPFQDSDLLLLPDGRRGYFGGWTAGGQMAFVEIGGVAYRVPRELLLQAQVLG